ncbi:MAG: hypothetical protein ABFC34_09120 [Methanobacterium sp.]
MDQKKNYEKPKLGVYGDVINVTKGGGDIQTDGGKVGSSLG